ncbi:MAG: discoidin domain-containing protein [Treponema sp.]|jgi:hypothetical protein|nr:discoidin domain-containing protein [Treponema sp.]
MKKPEVFAAFAAGAALLCLACTSTIGPKKSGPVDYAKQFEAAYTQLQVASSPVRQDKQPLVLAHYMPWFQAPPAGEQYGFHWHQGGAKFDPYETLSDGRANISSHYYPLTGPYDSSDVNLLEYQAALMKLSGIDGVIFDWYGIRDALDYKAVHDAAVAMVAALDRAGLRFAVCYEDQSISHMIEGGSFDKSGGLEEATRVFAWLQENWFTKENYVKLEGRPVVYCFGPQYFQAKTEWDAIFSPANPRPYFFDLDNRTSWADATYDWPPMWASSGGKLTIARLVTYLNSFYAKNNTAAHLTATAFPGFHDIYAQAGGKSYGFLDYADGETFSLTWTAAEKAQPDIIQIATWNDYGEGTVIEPTIEHGYKELEFLQDARKTRDEHFSYTYMDLRIPIELYKLAVSEKATAEQKQAVSDAYAALFAGDAVEFSRKARAIGIRFDISVSPLLRESGGQSQTAAVAVFDPAGRRNLALGKSVAVSSKIYDFTGAKAVDGDISSYWEGAADKYPNSVTIDLSSSIQLSTAVIRLNPQRIWGKRTQRIEVQVSDDNNAFTTLVPEADSVFDPGANGNAVAIPLNTKTRYVRLIVTTNTGAKAGQIAELEIYGQ